MRTVSISKGGQVDVSASKVLEIKEEIKMPDCFTKTQKSQIKQAWINTVSHKGGVGGPNVPKILALPKLG